MAGQQTGGIRQGEDALAQYSHQPCQFRWRVRMTRSTGKDCITHQHAAAVQNQAYTARSVAGKMDDARPAASEAQHIAVAEQQVG